MAGVIGTALVEVLPVTSKFSTALTTQMVGFAKKAGAALGIAFGVNELAQALGDTITQAEEARKVMAQTNAVIESTGGVAGISAKEVVKLSDSISKKIGVDDEAIQSGANLLLTFRDVRNEAGAGNKVFDRALRVSTDLSQALGQDLKSSVIQVGKALEDPIRGLTNLRRVGIQFSQSQEDMIRWLVASGDKLGAQKIILQELETQVGGSAAATATATDKMGVAFGNLQERIGQTLLPIKDDLAKFGLALLTAFDTGGFSAAFEVFKAKIASLPDAFRVPFELVIGILEGSFNVIKGIFDVFAGLFTGDWGRMWDGLVSIATGGLQNVVAIITFGLQVLGGIFQVAWTAIQAAASAAWGAIVATIQAIWGLLPSWLQSTLTAIAGIFVAGWNLITQVVTTAMSVITSVIQAGWALITGVIQIAMSVITTVIQTAWALITSVIQLAMTVITTVISTAWSIIQTIITTAMSIIQTIIETAWNAIRTAVETALNAIVSFIQSAWDNAKTIVTAALAAMGLAVIAGFTAIVTFVSEVPGKIVSALGDLGGLLVGAGAALMRGLLDGVVSAAESVLSFVASIPGKIASAFGGNYSIGTNQYGVTKAQQLGTVAGIAAGLAAGGPVMKGMPYIVGEKGPELFFPGRSGQIVPNSAMNGSGGSALMNTARIEALLMQIIANQRRTSSSGPSRAILAPRG